MQRSSAWRAGAVGIVALLLLGLGNSPTPDQIAVREYADRALAGLRDGYYVDTPEWKQTLAEQLPRLRAAESVPETYGPLTLLTKAAGGLHSSFSVPVNVRAKANLYPSGSVPAPSANFDTGIATLTIPGFSSARRKDVERFLDPAAEIFASERARTACGWIIDLTRNRGGNPWPMLAAVSPLLSDGVVSTVRSRDGSLLRIAVDGNTVRMEGRRWDADPIVSGRFGALEDRSMPSMPSPARLPGPPVELPDRPVAIVQSSNSASAAELIILSFAGQRKVTTFGEGTTGFTTMNSGFPMPDGAEVTLSFGLMGDRSEHFPSGAIPPDHEVDGDSDAARAAARSWVSEQCRTSGTLR